MSYVLPAYYHLLLVDPQSKVNLEKLDSTIKQTAKDFFHLPASTSNGLMYCRKGDGGYGLPKLSDMVRAAHLKALVTIETREDPVLLALVRGAENNRASKLARDIGLEWPTTSAAVERWKFERKTQYLSEWAAHDFQGKRVRCFRGNRNGNDWLFNPLLRRERKLI